MSSEARTREANVALASPNVVRVGVLTSHWHAASNPPLKPIVVPPPAYPEADRLFMARENLHRGHEQAMQQQEATVLSKKMQEQLGTDWPIRMKDRYPAWAEAEIARSQLSREMVEDASLYRMMLRVRKGMDIAEEDVTPPEPTHSTQDITERRMLAQQTNLGPQHGSHRAAFTRSTNIRPAMAARLAVARDSFKLDTIKYEPKPFHKPQHPQRLNVLDQLQKQTGMDRRTIAGLYTAFRAAARDTGLEEYRSAEHSRERLSRVDFCRVVFKTSMVPSMKHASRLFEMMVANSAESTVGGMDGTAFVAGWAALSKRGSSGLAGQTDLLFDLFSEQLGSELLTFNSAVQLISWVYHLIDWPSAGNCTTVSPADTLDLWDYVGASDDGLTRAQLQKAVQELALREKVRQMLLEAV